MLRIGVVFSVALILIGFGAFFLHKMVLGSMGVQLDLDLDGLYLFFGISALLVFWICLGTYSFVRDKVGLLYLLLFSVKLGVFILIYGSSLFGEVDINKISRLAILIPFFIFLMIEAIGVYAILNQKA